MKKVIKFFICSTLLFNCSPKTTPSSSTPQTNSSNTTKEGAAETAKADSIASTISTKKDSKKTVISKTATPKSITVNDKAATRTLDGRYYYDLENKRYWRNKKDGKYYLYYKGMFENKNFK